MECKWISKHITLGALSNVFLISFLKTVNIEQIKLTLDHVIIKSPTFIDSCTNDTLVIKYFIRIYLLGHKKKLWNKNNNIPWNTSSIGRNLLRMQDTRPRFVSERVVGKYSTHRQTQNTSKSGIHEKCAKLKPVKKLAYTISDLFIVILVTG